MSKVRILFVDDDNHFLEIIGEVLESAGFDVIKACTAESAIEILKGIKVEVVLTDFIMPGMSGLCFAETIAKSQPDIPIVIYTGADLGDFQFSFSGAHTVLTKPVAPAILIETLNRAISAARPPNLKYITESSKKNSDKG